MKPIFLVICLLISKFAAAKTVYYADSPETLKFAVGTETLVKFDSPVKTISSASLFEIKPANKEDPDFGLLTIEPRSVGSQSLVVFILANGTTLKLKLVAVKKDEKAEGFYELKSKYGEDREALSNQAFQVPGRLDLMRAMIRGDTLSGYDITTPNAAVSSGNADISTKLVKVYTGREFYGFIYELTNESSSKTYEIDIRRLKVGRPNAGLLSYTDLEKLPPSGEKKTSARIIVVTKPVGFGQNVLLPVGQIPKGKE